MIPHDHMPLLKLPATTAEVALTLQDMSEQHSHTAFGAAFLRAAHQLLDPPPHFLDDPVTVQLLAPQAIQHLLDHRERYQVEASRLLRAHVVLRVSQFCAHGVKPRS